MAKYFKQELPDLRNTGEQKFYYRMKVNENIDFDELVRRLTYPGSGLDKGQVVQVIAAIGKQMALEMASGNSVTIDGIGTFRASVGMTMPKELTDTDTGKETNARSLKVTGVIYRAASQLVRTISSQCTLVRDKEHRLRKSPYSNRVGGKRSSFLPTFVFRPLTPPYMRFRIRRFLFWVPFEIRPH